MIVRQLNDIIGSDRDVQDPHGKWASRRLLLKGDGMGFSMHDTLIHAGTESLFWYKNHLEGVYCVSGEGEIENLATGEIHPISDGTFYGLNLHDKHLLRARTQLRLICTFNPPLHGAEVHDAHGSYPPE
jgi:L-ectoine synthase